MSMINIICIKWGDKFSSDYVNNLYKGIAKWSTLPFSFTCYTEDCKNILPPIETKPIPFYTGDWFSKIGLYNKTLYNLEDQIFFFDLDTVVVGSLDDILSYSGNFAILRDFYRPYGLQSAFMSWRPEAVHFMWENYDASYKPPGGDQKWCEEQYPNPDIWQDMYPERIASYKVNVRDTHMGGVRGKVIDLDKVSIMCFHGKPLPHEIPEYWNL